MWNLKIDELELKLYLDAEWGSCGSITIDNIPLPVDKELGEVPLYVITEQSSFAWL